MNVLIISFEDRRWGIARLPKVLQAAGFRVAALCPTDNTLAYTKYIERHFKLPVAKSAHRLAPAIHRAMQAWQPLLVIPSDEMVVALLHALRRDLRAGNKLGWPAAMIDVLERSMGEPAHHDAMLFKNDTQELARTVGVRVPEGSRVRTAAEAGEVAGRLGYPVILKQSFSSGGNGVKVCQTPEQLAAAYEQMAPRATNPLKIRLRGLLGRDWYPTPGRLWVQQHIVGNPAMYTFVALHGRMLAGFAGLPRTTLSATGPSTVVEFRAHPELAEASARMVAALGATGFVSFDFVIETATGKAFLLECNPRPNQVSHLGKRMGVDLCATLLAGLRAGPVASDAASAPLVANRCETITLFPHEWLRASDSPAFDTFHHDVPWDDATLLKRLASFRITPTLSQNSMNPFNLMSLAKRYLTSFLLTARQ